MTWGLFSLRGASALRLSQALRFQSKCARATSAPITDQQLRPDGLSQAERRDQTQARMMMARREILIQTAAKMRDQRRSREASICEASARKVTNDILAMGEP